jgi:pyrimidine-nucleoside phosphorylase
MRVVTLGHQEHMRTVDVIAAKRDGEELPAETLHEFVLAYARDDIADYQMSAFLMAGFLNGFSQAEAVALTAAMVASGDELDLSRLAGPTVDKHSTGGVGDGTTLVVAPLAAELGMQVVKLSGRGLGHTGGTLDKLDAIPGMRTELAGDELIAQVEEIGLAVCAQTADLVPADKAMYALRDVTATVENSALIASSIMSKKLAGGADAILLDVKTGSGAFMKDVESARELADLCVALGEESGRATGALITDMSQPLADAVGNASEVREAIEILRGERSGRFPDLCIALAGHMAALTGVTSDPERGVELARKALASGAALERFRRFVEAQGGDPRVVEDPSRLPSAPVCHEVRAGRDGWLEAVDAEAIGRAAAGVGAGRQRKEDRIDLAVGIDFLTAIGDPLEADQVVAHVLANDAETAETAGRQVLDALSWSDTHVDAPPLIHDVIGRRLGQAG